MGRNLPAQNNAALDWLEGHIDLWQSDPAAIGLSPAQADALADQIADARAALTAATTAKSAAITSTARYNAAADAMRASAGGLIATIKSFADTSSNPSSVYRAAALLAKDPRGAARAPDTPVITSCLLRADGTVALRFEATGPSGTVYAVSRRLESENEFSLVGFAHGREKAFEDAALPSGTPRATYAVRGIRGQLAGEQSVPVSIFLGSPASGAALTPPAMAPAMAPAMTIAPAA